MTNQSKKYIYTAVILVLCFTRSLFSAETYNVNTLISLKTAIRHVSPGDQIVVSNGIYTTVEPIIVDRQGTAEQPVIITAQSIGGVEIRGNHGFVIVSPAAYVVIKGFRFSHQTGTTLIATGVTHCVLTRNVFECAPVHSGNKPYLNVMGDDNEISYNTFQNKTDEGCMITVQGPGENKVAKRTWIHHNYFYNFPPTANNCSAIQIGLSRRSMDSAFSVVEYNLFVKTAGENEGGVCNKSCMNTYRYNIFGEGCRELSLRHGNFCKVYGNLFLGSTGIRFSGDDHQIYSNYFSNCSDAIVCNSGDGEVADGAKLTSHDRPDRVKVVYNTIVECRHSFSQSARKNGMGATSITFADNILVNSGAPEIAGAFINSSWEGNILWNTPAGAIPANGFLIIDPKLKKDNNGIYRISEDSPVRGAGSACFPFVKTDMFGQPKGNSPDAGASQFSKEDIKILSVSDVGPDAAVLSTYNNPVYGKPRRGTSAGDPEAQLNYIPGSTPESWAKAAAATIMARYPDYRTAYWKDWSYVQGYMLSGFEMLYISTHEKKYLDFIKRYIDCFVDEQGNFTGDKLSNLDNLMTGRLIVDLYQYTRDERYRIAAKQFRDVFDTYPRSDGQFWHGNSKPNMWIDGIFMGQMFLIRYGQVFKESYAFTEAARQITVFAKHCHKGNSGLYLHAWTEKPKENAWSDTITGLSPEVWSEGLGWYALVVPELLSAMPQKHPQRAEVLDIYLRLMEGLKNTQDTKTGGWFMIVDKGDQPGNWIDPSGTAMFVYSIQKGINMGLLDKKTYEPVAENGYKSLLRFVKINDHGLADIYGGGDGITIKKDYESYVRVPQVVNAKEAVAGFLWASAIMEKLLK